MPSIPKAFISYSHDSQEHKKWVLELAARLRNNGIDAIIDQYELTAGDDIPHFMESNLSSADKILMVCTEKYVDKANKGEGGVGYEKMVITSNLLKRIDENKIIPIIKQSGIKNVPVFIKTKLYIDFSNDEDFEATYDDLVRCIHKTPLFVKPPIGNNPFIPIQKEKLDGDIDLLHIVLKQIVSLYEEDVNFISITDLAIELQTSKLLVDIAIIKLRKLGYLEWYINGKSVELSEKGKLYAFQNKLYGYDNTAEGF